MADDRDRDLHRIIEAAETEGVRLSQDEAARVASRFRDDFADVFGCRCCEPAHATGERVERMRRPA